VGRIGDEEEEAGRLRFEGGELRFAALDPGRQLAQHVALAGELERLLVEPGHALVGTIAPCSVIVERVLELFAARIEQAIRRDLLGHIATAPQHLRKSVCLHHFVPLILTSWTG
jgi:hypothetical protein